MSAAQAWLPGAPPALDFWRAAGAVLGATGVVTARYVALLLVDTYARSSYRTLHGIGEGGISAEQQKREAEWPLSFLIVWALGVGIMYVINLAAFPLFTAASLLWTALLHAAVVEPVYYAFHVAAHHPRVYRRWHQWHHLSVETTAWSSVSFRIAEHLAYDAMFTIPLIVPVFLGQQSVAAILAYSFFFDLTNSLGHAGFELFPPSYIDTTAFLFFYCPSFHRVHHTHFHSNYSLFMPIWDVMFGTYDREATLKNLQQAETRGAVSYKFLLHCILPVHGTHWQGPLTVKTIQKHYTFWQHVASALLYIVSLLHICFPIDRLPVPFGVWLADSKVSTAETEGAIEFIPAYAAWYFIPGFRRLILRYQCRLVLRAQRENPKCRVIGLGCLNKMEQFNHGGAELVRRLGPRLNVCVVHGSTMTAAAVIDAALAVLREEAAGGAAEGAGAGRRVFLTGSTSKVGRATALALAAQGVRVLMHSASAARVNAIAAESADPALIEHVTSLADGAATRVWVNGKFAGTEVFAALPDGCRVINFAEPSGFELQDRAQFDARGIRVTHGGVFRYVRAQGLEVHNTAFLPLGYFYACHVGTAVHAAEAWDFHEVDEVDVSRLDGFLALAARHGFERSDLSCFAEDMAAVPAPAPPPPAPRRVVTAAEVATHAAEGDCWVTVRGRAYDLTQFLDRHPGGRAALLRFAGKDATATFDLLHPPGTLEAHAPPPVADVAAAPAGDAAADAAAPAGAGGRRDRGGDRRDLDGSVLRRGSPAASGHSC